MALMSISTPDMRDYESTLQTLGLINAETQMKESKMAIELDRALYLERNAEEAEARVIKLRDRLRFLQQQCNEKKAQASTLRNDLTMQGRMQMCLEMRSLSAQAIGTDGENYEFDADHRYQKLKALHHAASEVEMKIRTSRNDTARAALHRLLLMDSHFGTYTRAIEQVVGLIERIKAAANAEQLSEAEVEHFDQVRSTLKSLVPDPMTCEPSLHQQAIDEVRRVALFGSERVLAFITDQCGGEEYGAPGDVFDGPGSPHSGYASSSVYYAAQHPLCTPSPTEHEVMSE